MYHRILKLARSIVDLAVSEENSVRIFGRSAAIPSEVNDGIAETLKSNLIQSGVRFWLRITQRGLCFRDPFLMDVVRNGKSHLLFRFAGKCFGTNANKLCQLQSRQGGRYVMIRETSATRESQFGQHSSNNYTARQAMLHALVSQSVTGPIGDADGPGTRGGHPPVCEDRV